MCWASQGPALDPIRTSTGTAWLSTLTKKQRKASTASSYANQPRARFLQTGTSAKLPLSLSSIFPLNKSINQFTVLATSSIHCSRMPHRNLRKRNPPARRGLSSGKITRPSPFTRFIDAVKIRDSGNLLKRSKSEPSLWKPAGRPDATVSEEDDGVLYRPRTCADIFSTPDHSMPQSPANCSEGYNKDAKVVVNISVEGSPGPIRTMVRLGSNVEETIKLVINKYNEEGRTPRLDQAQVSAFELHHSHFTLESLSKSDLIGDIGSRNFYLRRCNSSGASEKTSASSNQLEVYPLPFLPNNVNRKIKKMIYRTRKVWRIFGCILCTG